MGGELISKSQHDYVKTICIDRFQVKMPIDNPVDLTGDFVFKSHMGKPFDEFRNITKKEKLEDFLRSSCFGKFLKMPEDNNGHFQMSMVYDFLKHMIRYVGDDKDLKEGGKILMKSGLTTVAYRFVLA
ncbi:hypothetical protein FXO38_20812 [Capsicum annuum]|nr:hypothetical protein FXO38_20812 [Capsicum annuum]